MRVYGNWCGPGWTAGQYKDASELTEDDRDVPAIDELDAHCKTHDILLHDYPEYADEINAEFIKHVQNLGITGALFALAVQVGGPSPSTVNNLPTTAQTPMPKKSILAKNAEEYRQAQLQHRQQLGLGNQVAKLYVDRVEESKQSDSTDLVTPQRADKRTINKISPPLERQSAAKRFPWKQIASLSNLQQSREDNMSKRPIEDTGDVEMQGARLLSGGSESNTQTSKETPILYATPSYMLQETHTTILPITIFCSGVLGDNYQGLDFKFRLTDYKKPFTTTAINAAPPNVAGGWGAKFTTGFYRSKIPQFEYLVTNGVNAPNLHTASIGSISYSGGNCPNAQRWTHTKYKFPQELSAAASTLKCKTADFWDKLYQFYTVLSCEYEIIIENTNQSVYLNSDIVAASVIDTYTNLKSTNQTALNQPMMDVFT